MLHLLRAALNRPGSAIQASSRCYLRRAASRSVNSSLRFSLQAQIAAGLVDGGEDAAKAGERELYEETGYRGKTEEVSPMIVSDPGKVVVLPQPRFV